MDKIEKRRPTFFQTYGMSVYTCIKLSLTQLENHSQLLCGHDFANERILGCVSLRKSKIGFLNPKESENGFCAPLLNRLIEDHSDHGTSKEPKNPFSEWILRSL